MPVHVELVLRMRDDESENPTLTQTTACTIEAASGPEAIREALWDILCRSGYGEDQNLEMLAWVIDQMTWEVSTSREEDADMDRAEAALAAAARAVLDAWEHWRKKQETSQ